MTPRIQQRIVPLLAALLLLSACHGPILNSDPTGRTSRQSLPAGVPTPRQSPIALGKPIPNFTAPDQNNAPVTTAELISAPGSTLIIIPQDGNPAVRPAYAWARNHRQSLANRRIELLILNPMSPKENAQIAKREDLRIAILSDPALHITRGFGVSPGSTWTFVLGSNGRIQLAQPGLPTPSDIIMAAEALPGRENESIFSPF